MKWSCTMELHSLTRPYSSCTGLKACQQNAKQHVLRVLKVWPASWSGAASHGTYAAAALNAERVVQQALAS